MRVTVDWKVKKSGVWAQFYSYERRWVKLSNSGELPQILCKFDPSLNALNSIKPRISYCSSGDSILCSVQGAYFIPPFLSVSKTAPTWLLNLRGSLFSCLADSIYPRLAKKKSSFSIRLFPKSERKPMSPSLQNSKAWLNTVLKTRWPFGRERKKSS